MKLICFSFFSISNVEKHRVDTNLSGITVTLFCPKYINHSLYYLNDPVRKKITHENPNCLHTTCVFSFVHDDPQTVPHVSLYNTSRRPSLPLMPPARRMSSATRNTKEHLEALGCDLVMMPTWRRPWNSSLLVPSVGGWYNILACPSYIVKLHIGHECIGSWTMNAMCVDLNVLLESWINCQIFVLNQICSLGFQE